MKGWEQRQPEAAPLPEQANFNKKELNDFVSLLADVLRAPVALISLPGYEKVILREKGNIEIEPTDREFSFCHHMAAKNEMMVIDDTRFSAYLDHNFMAPGNRNIRFYCGVPLHTSEGLPLGALCLFDESQRTLSIKHRRQIAVFCRQVCHLVEADGNVKTLRRQQFELEQQKEKIATSERKLKAFFKSSGFCHVLIGKDLEVVDFNSATAVFIKQLYNKNVQISKCILDYIHPTYRVEFLTCLNRAFAGRKSNKEVLISSENYEPTWWNIFLEPMKDDAGRVVGVVYNATNINEQKKRMAEITTQNEILSNIAYIQSHDYRKPVASILGLMEVLKLNNQPLSQELRMMEEAVKELDDKIRSVINFTQVLSARQLV